MKFVKLIAKLFLLFAPILAGMMYFSYTVDPAGLFQGAGFERQAVDYMLDGEYVRGYERLDGRELNEIFARRVEYTPQILVNGSSRVMLIDDSFADDKSFYNAGNTGADIYDIFTGYYIFEKAGKEPEIYVLGIDPWIFNGDKSAIDMRSNKELYYEFVSGQLGYTFDEYVRENPYEKYKALIEPSYFQSSIDYYLNGDDSPSPQIVPREELEQQTEVVKLPDGSIYYGVEFTTRDQSLADFDAMGLANTDISRLYDFNELSAEYTAQFEDYIKYLLDKNIKLVLFLPAYHPIVYQKLQEDAQYYSGVFKAEEFIVSLAKKYNIPLYGSYDPSQSGFENTDFMDGLHLRKESVRRLLGNIE